MDDKLTFPWCRANDLVGGGVYQGTCNVITGKPGTGKTYVATKIANHLVYHGVQVMAFMLDPNPLFGLHPTVQRVGRDLLEEKVRDGFNGAIVLDHVDRRLAGFCMHSVATSFVATDVVRSFDLQMAANVIIRLSKQDDVHRGTFLKNRYAPAGTSFAFQVEFDGSTGAPEKVDPHEGMIKNPMTGEWSWF